jgi:hypothetical protein
MPEIKKKNVNKEITNSNVEQEILTSNLDKVANYFTANQNLFNYATFRQVNGDGSRLINRLRGIDNFDVFYKIKNSVLSLMRPKIRLYKMLHELPGSNEIGSSDDSKTTALRMPKYREIKFSDTAGVERTATVQDYLKYESTKPSWRNVGLESFSFSQDGRTHGAIEQNIDCTLKLTFKSLKDIQASPPGEPPPEQGGIRYVDLITWTAAKKSRLTDTYNPKHYIIKVLIGYTALDEDQLRSLNLSKPEVDAIRNIERHNIILSLNLYDYQFDIKENGAVALTIRYRGAIETTIASNQVNIFQNIVRVGSSASSDALAISNSKEHPAAVLNAQTTFRSVMRALKKPSCKDDKCKARTTLKEMIETPGFFSDIFKEEFATAGSGFPAETGVQVSRRLTQMLKDAGVQTSILKVIKTGKVYEFLKKDDNAKKLQNRMKEKVGFYKKEIYRSFLSQIVDGNIGPDGHGSRLFCAAAAARGVELLVTDSGGDAGLTAGETKKPIGDIKATEASTSLTVPAFKILREGAGLLTKKEINDVIKSDSEFGTESSSKDKGTGDTEKEKDKKFAPIVSSDEDSFKFYFMFLGDIVELACKNAGLGRLDLQSDSPVRNEGSLVFNERSYYDENNVDLDYPLKTARMLLGPMEYMDSEDRVRKINLAQMPISFNLFRSWFIKKVIRSQRLQMSLGAFLTSLIKDVVLPALGVGMSKNRRAPRTRHNFVSLTLPGKISVSGALEELLPKKQVLNTDDTLFEQQYFTKVNKMGYSSESLIKNSFDYLLLHITTHEDITVRTGDPVKDLNDGIYHFNIGSDVGILKSMSFTRVGVPGLAEARSMDNEILGTDRLDQLKFPYNTDLTLIGNSLFVPGMFYYVNPSLAGLGSVEDSTSLAYKMNLGGYHLILKTTLTINASRFETKVEGFQQ